MNHNIAVVVVLELLAMKGWERKVSRKVEDSMDCWETQVVKHRNIWAVGLTETV